MNASKESRTIKKGARIALIVLLLDRNIHYTTAELARFTAVNIRTIQRDVRYALRTHRELADFIDRYKRDTHSCPIGGGPLGKAGSRACRTCWRTHKIGRYNRL